MFTITIPQSLEQSFRLPEPIHVHVAHGHHYRLVFFHENGQLVYTKAKYDVDGPVPNVEVRWSDRNGLSFIRGDFILYLFLTKVFQVRA